MSGGYRNSPRRYAVLAGLLGVMGVLGVLLWQKWEREAAADRAADADPPPAAPAAAPPPPPREGARGPRLAPGRRSGPLPAPATGPGPRGAADPK